MSIDSAMMDVDKKDHSFVLVPYQSLCTRCIMQIHDMPRFNDDHPDFYFIMQLQNTWTQYFNPDTDNKIESMMMKQDSALMRWCSSHQISVHNFLSKYCQWPEVFKVCPLKEIHVMEGAASVQMTVCTDDRPLLWVRTTGKEWMQIYKDQPKNLLVTVIQNALNRRLASLPSKGKVQIVIQGGLEAYMCKHRAGLVESYVLEIRHTLTRNGATVEQVQQSENALRLYFESQTSLLYTEFVPMNTCIVTNDGTHWVPTFPYQSHILHVKVNGQIIHKTIGIQYYPLKYWLNVGPIKEGKQYPSSEVVKDREEFVFVDAENNHPVVRDDDSFLCTNCNTWQSSNVLHA